MFEQLFEPRVLARHRAGPLLEERRRFLAHLAEQGLSRYTLRKTADFLLRITDTLDLASRPGESISRDEVKRKSIDKRHRHVSVATRWLEFLGRLERRPVLTGPCTEKIRSFANHMQHERGLSSVTVSRRAEFIQQFLARLGTTDGSLHKITVTQIDECFWTWSTRTVMRGERSRTGRVTCGLFYAMRRYTVGVERDWRRQSRVLVLLPKQCCLPGHPGMTCVASWR